jgi:diaminopimelate epimerase
MSGNGVRCAASFLVHQELVDDPEILFQTGSGLKIYTLLEGSAPRWSFRSRMGQPSFSTADLPCLAPESMKQIQDHPLQVSGHIVKVNLVWVGNPQCVVFREDLPDDEEFDFLGSRLEVHEFFPERTNVSFVVRESEHSIRIRIWERGVGPTHSSGTGSCGAAVTSIYKGMVASPVQVHTATGSQKVEWSSGQEIRLTGDCEFIAQLEFSFGD